MPGFENCKLDHFEAGLKGNRLFLAAQDHKTGQQQLPLRNALQFTVALFVQNDALFDTGTYRRN
jgi:hypothetical protein